MRKKKLDMRINVINLGKVSITVDKDPWDSKKAYDRLTIVFNEEDGISYISRRPVPVKSGQIITQDNKDYWIPLGKPSINVNFGAFTLLNDISLLPDSEDNDSPYLIDGVAYFYVGTDGDTLDGAYQSVALEGKRGKSAFEIWQEETDDFTTTEAEWLENYVKGKNGTNGLNGQDGEDGNNGASAFEIWQKHNPSSTIDEATWLNEYVKGQDGEDGKSAFEIWQEEYHDNLTTRLQWLQQYVHGANGNDGKSAYEIWKSKNPSINWTEQQWLDNYVQGVSAYEVAMRQLDLAEEPRITISEWLESLIGPPGLQGPQGPRGRDGYSVAGPQGPDGKSAFEIANEVQEANGLLPYANPAAWLLSLKGPKGDAEVIRSMTVVDGVLIIVTQVGTTDLNPKTYRITLPIIQGGDPGISPDPNPDIPLRMGSLAAAKTYAESYPTTYFQWILSEQVTEGEGAAQQQITIKKPIWHTGLGEFIDALGYVLQAAYIRPEDTPGGGIINDDNSEEEEPENE